MGVVNYAPRLPAFSQLAVLLGVGYGAGYRAVLVVVAATPAP